MWVKQALDWISSLNRCLTGVPTDQYRGFQLDCELEKWRWLARFMVGKE